MKNINKTPSNKRVTPSKRTTPSKRVTPTGSQLHKKVTSSKEEESSVREIKIDAHNVRRVKSA